MKRVLVTGASGFIGGHVAADLLANGYAVRGLVRTSEAEARLPEGCEPATGDILDMGALMRAAEGCAAVVHVAAAYSLAKRRAREVERTNVSGTANVVAAVRALGCRLVHTSSVATIGLRADGGPADEDTPMLAGQTIGAYKRSKVASERLVLAAAEAGVDATVVNPSAPVGPRDWRPTPTGRIVRDYLRGRMAAYVDTGLNLVDVRDVAAGHRLALERGRPGRRYILGCADMTLQEILAALSKIAGRPAPTRRVPHAAAIAVAAVDEVIEGWLLGREPLAALDGARMARHRMFFSSARAVRELDLPQTPVARALAEAVDWHRAALDSGHGDRTRG